MTAPPPDAGAGSPAPRPWYAHPGFVFGLLGLIILGTVLLTPTQGRTGDGRLTTLSRAPQGARAFADLASRLGWRVVRDSSVPTRAPLAADRVYAVLAPPEELTGREYGRLFDAVRRGAGLLVVHPGGGAIEDSLGIERVNEGATMRLQPGAAACPTDEPRYAINWPGGDVWSFWLKPKRALADTVQWLPVGRTLTSDEKKAGADSAAADTAARDTAATDSATTDTATTDTAATDTADASDGDDGPSFDAEARITVPAAIGMRLGRGRVVVVADADWLRNDVVRVCRWHAGVTAVRMLEWLSDGGAGRTIVFDEWHQGRGIHPSAGAAFVAFIGRDPRGRALLQGVVAALVLLAALGARPLVPALRTRIERRSPFEHVGALARAYEEIGATRLVTRRLVRGLRRRVGASPALRDEESFLAALEVRHPPLAADIALVRAALADPVAPAQLLEVGRAVSRIERSLRTT